MLKVKDDPSLQRDPHSKAILNVDKNAYNEYLQKKLVKEKILSMDSEINTIKQSINEIKKLLLKMADK